MYDYTILSEAVQGSNSIKECFVKMGLRPSGSSYRIFYKACEEHGIVPPKATAAHRLSLGQSKRTRSLEEILIENSTYSTASLMKRIIDANLLEEECDHCGVGPIWNGKLLRLQVDHINGISNDHRIENLRLLCPNCHSQTDTWCGKNTKKKRHPGNCINCDSVISWNSTKCKSCVNLDKNTRIVWPSDSDLIKRLVTSNFSFLARELGVSDNAIRKRLKVRGLLGASYPIRTDAK